jgi:hypothetical protein
MFLIQIAASAKSMTTTKKISQAGGFLVKMETRRLSQKGQPFFTFVDKKKNEK